MQYEAAFSSTRRCANLTKCLFWVSVHSTGVLRVGGPRPVDRVEETMLCCCVGCETVGSIYLNVHYLYARQCRHPPSTNVSCCTCLLHFRDRFTLATARERIALARWDQICAKRRVRRDPRAAGATVVGCSADCMGETRGYACRFCDAACEVAPFAFLYSTQVPRRQHGGAFLALGLSAPSWGHGRVDSRHYDPGRVPGFL